MEIIRSEQLLVLRRSSLALVPLVTYVSTSEASTVGRILVRAPRRCAELFGRCKAVGLAVHTAHASTAETFLPNCALALALDALPLGMAWAARIELVALR